MAVHTVNHGRAQSFIGRRSTFRSTPRDDQGLCARGERLKEQGDGLLGVLTVVAQPGGDARWIVRPGFQRPDPGLLHGILGRREVGSAPDEYTDHPGTSSRSSDSFTR
jgi:hypothetical protein